MVILLSAAAQLCVIYMYNIKLTEESAQMYKMVSFDRRQRNFAAYYPKFSARWAHQLRLGGTKKKKNPANILKFAW